jgi:virulence-associated protein VapD
MYAIAFDLHQDTLSKTYGSVTYTNAYNDIKKVLNSYKFTRQQGSVYFGDSTVDAADCVMAIQDLTNLYPWFSASVQDIRMLRIEENNDLRKIIDKELSKKNN